MKNCKSIDSHMDSNEKLLRDQGDFSQTKRDIEGWLENSFILL